MKTLFAITHINRDGMRQLTRANQGRNHFATEAEAEKHLTAMLLNNKFEDLQKLYGDPLKMDVRPVECYDSGDAVGIFFDDPDAPFDKQMKQMGIK